MDINERFYDDSNFLPIGSPMPAPSTTGVLLNQLKLGRADRTTQSTAIAEWLRDQNRRPVSSGVFAVVVSATSSTEGRTRNYEANGRSRVCTVARGIREGHMSSTLRPTHRSIRSARRGWPSPDDGCWASTSSVHFAVNMSRRGCGDMLE
ncbi:MAG: hypothetical protein ACRDTD_29395, partial [Pseudonocardiaceae bacterium]